MCVVVTGVLSGCQNQVLSQKLQTTTQTKLHMEFNPLAPTSDKHLNSPYIITPESNMKVTRIEEVITNLRNSWLLNKFSLSASLEMYGEQYREYAYWC